MANEITPLPWTRRAVLRGGALLIGVVALAPRRLFAAEASFALPKATVDALAKSPLVYVSPLLTSGKQSSCHAEVWYFWDKDAVVIGTATNRWKVKAVKSGRDKARLWVGEYGSSAPTFVAKATIDKDPATQAVPVIDVSSGGLLTRAGPVSRRPAPRMRAPSSQ